MPLEKVIGEENCRQQLPACSTFCDQKHRTHLGWFVSHIEGNGQEYLAVTNFSDLKPTDRPGYGGMQAKAITKKILSDLNLF